MVGYEKQDVKIRPKKYTIVGHSCLMPSFGLTMKVGGLRSVLEGLDDEDLLHITINDKDDAGMPKPTEWSVSKAVKKGVETLRTPPTSNDVGIRAGDIL